MWKGLAVLVLAVCTAFIPGCAPSGTGDVSVHWAVGLTGSCSSASLDYVVARLETDEGVLVARQDEYCDAGLVRFTDVPVGSFRARLVGYDEENVEAYETVVADVAVQEGLEGGPYIGRLAPRPATIGLLWYFQGGRLCSTYGVERIVVHLFSDDTELERSEFACDRGAARLADLDSGVYDIRVDALDARGETTHTFVLAGLKLRPGHEVELETPLQECGGQCL
jgi:hypothetical protein